MENNDKTKIINIVIIVCIGLALIFGIYLYIKLQSTKSDVYSEDIYKYLNQDTNNDSVIYGLLSYDFENINGSLKTEVLTNSYFMQKSMLNDDGVNNIYNNTYGHNKDYVLSASNYLSSPLANCYYYQDTLKKNINCNNICSKNENDIISVMNKSFQWDNILHDDVVKFCLKNPVYSLEGSGYFVNLNDLKDLFKSITSVDLSFQSDITSNKYYSYGAYLSNDLSNLSNYVVGINEIKSVSKNGELFDVEYTALLNNSKTINGKCKLKYIDDKYYINSNSINLGNVFN